MTASADDQIAIQQDVVSQAPMAGLAACLDLPASAYATAVPPLWHWLLFLDPVPSHALGNDGHRAQGGLVPRDPNLPARMWAGGRLRFLGELVIGQTVSRKTSVASVTERQGRSGALRFVTLLHRIRHEAGVVIEEEQDLVFRAPPAARAAAAFAAPPAAAGAVVDSIVPDAKLLFRFSALTFNAHRIHYDLAYATEIEHYPGLVVHGPLQAILLAGHLQRAAPGARLQRFDFRAESPAFAGQKLQLEAWPKPERPGEWHLQTRNPDGAICVRATAETDR